MSILPHLPSGQSGTVSLTADEQTLAASLAELTEPVLITRADLVVPGPTIVAVGQAMTTLTGYSAGELIGRNPRLFQGPLTDRAVLTRLRRACEKGEHFVGETVNYRKDGSTYILQWTVDPIFDRAGRVTHFFALQRDITAQRAFAGEWLQAEERARSALEQLGAHMTLVAQTILVLEKTKRSFRSKELGALRELLLEATSQMPPGQASRPADSAHMGH